MPKPKIILDCDPGHDDAIAILLAGRHTDLLGITTVNGNVNLDLTTHNALVTAQILNLEVPVYRGASAPLVAAPLHAPDIHGETGLGGPELPPLTRKVAGHDAVHYLIDTIRQHDDLWLVAVGPLTNVALALSLAPDIAGKLKGISVMGGSSTFGNTTPAAEFNILADPEAADIVFRSGANLFMCGLDLTHQFDLRREDLTTIRSLDNRAAHFVADMIEFFGKTYADHFFGAFTAPLHDPCAVLALTHPKLLTFEPRHVSVELRGEHTRGMTVVDERKVRSDLPKNVQVGKHIDRDKALKVLMETISSY
ncbi:pyrimidine-specific ribonucleoside hydrolase RihA [soil metagenome]